MRSVRPGGKYRSIRHTKISEIQTEIFGRMERAHPLPNERENCVALCANQSEPSSHRKSTQGLAKMTYILESADNRVA